MHRSRSSGANVRAALVGLTVLAACGIAPRPPKPPTSLDVPPATRLVVIAPHPDDETLAAGGLMQRVLATGGTVRVIALTPGDGYLEAAAALSGHPTPSQADYRALGDTRIRELLDAARILGLRRGSVVLIRGPDDGLADLWGDHYWFSGSRYVSPHTGRGPSSGEDLLGALCLALAEASPTVVVAPDKRDTQSDHAAAGRFVLAALTRRKLHPVLLTYFVHDALWPPPLSQGSVMPPPPDAELAGTRWVSFTLTPEERATKARALRAHASQWPVLGGLLERFLRDNEVFASVRRTE